MQDSGTAAMSELCRPKGVETLIVPSDADTKTFIPFGMDGTSVIISPYGDILRMSRYLEEDEPRIICLGSPALRGYQRDLVGVGDMLHEVAQTLDAGLHIRLLPKSGDQISSMETRLEWINGRWPCIYFEIDGLEVSVLFTVNHGILSQQYLIGNPSAEQKSFRFALQIGGAQVNTLHVEETRWVGADVDEWSEEQQNLPHTSYGFQIAEKEWEKTPETMGQDVDTAKIATQGEALAPETVHHGSGTAKITTRGEAVIAVFHNDELLKPENAFQIPIGSNDSDSDTEESDDEQKLGNNASSAPSNLLDVASCGVQKLVVQYNLQPYGCQDSKVSLFQETGAFLKSEGCGNWSFVKDDDFNPVFRRHLEYILCLCLIKDGPRLERQYVPFINDITFESGSTPMNDL